MTQGSASKGEEKDGRVAYYWSQVCRHGQRYREFHWPSTEVLLNLAYTFYGMESRLARKIAAHGLSPSAFNALMILSRSASKGCPLHELSDLLIVSRANITGLVDSLVRKRLARRTAHRGDRRVCIARITKAGEALLESLLPDHYAEVRKICSGLNRAEKAALTNLLTKLRRGVECAFEDCRITGQRRRKG